MNEREDKMEENTEEILEENKNNEEKEDNNKEDTNQTTKLQLEEATDRMKRIAAEFENYKKRSAKEKEMLYKSILGDIVSQLLPVIDNLENAANAETKDESYKAGVELVLKQFSDVLASLGVETIKTVGETFDPELHEAVSSVQDESLGEKEIKEEFRKGYKVGSKVIRHAMVSVAN